MLRLTGYSSNHQQRLDDVMPVEEGIDPPIPFSPDEQRQIRLVRLLVYIAPVVIGALSLPMLLSLTMLLGRNHFLSETMVIVGFWLNVLVAGAAAAYAAARLHPNRAGAWWRASAAFGFASATAVATFLVTSRIAASLDYHL